jgi:hypothetical protein
MLNHLIDTLFRAATFRMAHFLPLGGALAVMAVTALFLMAKTARRQQKTRRSTRDWLTTNNERDGKETAP